MNLIRSLLFTTLISSAAFAQTATADQPQKSGAQVITFAQALKMAQMTSVEFLSATTDAAVAREDAKQARDALLPSAAYNGQYLYTQGNGTGSGVFIANNGVHEYISEGNAHQPIDLTRVADYRRAHYLDLVARAKAEIARRGLQVTVAQAYYGAVVAERKYANAERAFDAANQFLKITQDLERGGEVAHSDVIKAQLQANDSRRTLQEAQLDMESTHAALGVLIFPKYNNDFSVVDDLQLPEPLPAQPEIEKLAAENNPQLNVALAAVHAADKEVLSARSGYLPALTLDYWYGIDANHFAEREPNGIQNAGYSASATVSLPLWNWGATQSKVKQAELKRTQARAELSLAQRQLLSNLETFYHEAETARAELETLRSSADLAAESERLTRLRYQAGESNVLEVVDAQTALATARNAYDDGALRYRVAIANLQTLTGNF